MRVASKSRAAAALKKSKAGVASLLTAVASGLVLAMAAAPASAEGPNLVVNPSFETGNFTGWTLGGNADSFSVGVQCAGGSLVREGSCSAYSAAIGTPATL